MTQHEKPKTPQRNDWTTDGMDMFSWWLDNNQVIGGTHLRFVKLGDHIASGKVNGRIVKMTLLRNRLLRLDTSDGSTMVFSGGHGEAISDNNRDFADQLLNGIKK